MHCKDVSFHDVDIPLTVEAIADLMDGWRSYVRTDVLVLRNGDDHAVLELVKAPGTGLFRDLVSYEVVALPDDIDFHEDPELDVLNLPAMAEVQMMYPGRAVVVRGMFSHMSFIKGLEPLRLRVVDNVPPSPAKLSVLVRKALASGFVDLPVIVDDRIIDMAHGLTEVGTEAVMFPCRVSNLTADRPVYFLDDRPDVVHDVTLIGCHLSKRIFHELYGSEVPFINVCPSDFVDPDEMTIVKCCKVKNGHEIEGNTVRVPWGATIPEVVDAINALFSVTDRHRCIRDRAR